MLNNSTSQYMKSCRSYKRKDEITINVIIALLYQTLHFACLITESLTKNRLKLKCSDISFVNDITSFERQLFNTLH